MKLLLKDVVIVDPLSRHHRQKKSILIENRMISQIASSVPVPARTTVWHFENGHVSPGWFDVGTQVGEPGHEFREDLDSVSDAAMHGGYTGIASFPNTIPVLQTKAQVQFVLNKSREQLLEIHPIGSLSYDHLGTDLCELIDLQRSGAIAFSDGSKSIQNNGLMLRALEYVKSFRGLVIHQAEDYAISKFGNMHEGGISTRLGTQGIPSIAEKILVERDISVNKYAESRLLIHNISSELSLSLIRNARDQGQNVHASTTYMNLVEIDHALSEFDVNFKVLPPLRAESDRIALLDGIREGLIEIITTNHCPVEQELKHLEFDHAEFGAIGLETCFAVLRTKLKDSLELDLITQCLSHNPRKILCLPELKIESGQTANLTVFDPDLEWVYEEKLIRSKSKNSPYIGKTLQGKALGVINKGMAVKVSEVPSK